MQESRPLTRRRGTVPQRRDSGENSGRGRTGPLLLASLFVCIFIILFHTELAPLPSQLLQNSTRNSSFPFFPSSTKDSLHSQVDDDEPDNACMYESWQSLLPPLITVNDSSSTRRRYDTLPRITTTVPLPFTNVTLRSSFKAGSSFMSALVKSLYAGNETRQLWFNETRKRRRRNKDLYPPLLNVAFLRDPIDRFKSMYAQMLKFSNRKYHWYGDGDADWIDMTECTDRVRTFVASVKRRFYNEHLLPQLWFLSEASDHPPNLTFVGRLESLSNDWAVMAKSLGIPHDVARDGQVFIDKKTSPKENAVAVRNMNNNDNAKISLQHALYEEPDANATLLDVCNIYRCDFSCFGRWLHAPHVCTQAWKKS